MLKKLINKLFSHTTEKEERYARFLDFCAGLKKEGFKPLKSLNPFKGFRHDHVIETDVVGKPESEGATYTIDLIGKTKRFNQSGEYNGKALTVTFNGQAVVLKEFDGRIVIDRGPSVLFNVSDEVSYGIEKAYDDGADKQTVFEGQDRYKNAGQAVKSWVRKNA